MSETSERQREAELHAWALAGDFNPALRLSAEQAAASNRAILAAAGLDVDAFERKMSIPAWDGANDDMTISFSASRDSCESAKKLAMLQGRDRSDLLRDALSEYLVAHAPRQVAA